MIRSNSRKQIRFSARLSIWLKREEPHDTKSCINLHQRRTSDSFQSWKMYWKERVKQSGSIYWSILYLSAFDYPSINHENLQYFSSFFSKRCCLRCSSHLRSRPWMGMKVKKLSSNQIVHLGSIFASKILNIHLLFYFRLVNASAEPNGHHKTKEVW